MESLHILVVDDEPHMRAAMVRALDQRQLDMPDLGRHLRFATATAETGEAALDYLAAHPVDILLLDQKLPGMQGSDVLRRVTEAHRDVVAIMVTAYASIAAAVSATKQGAFDFLAKPFTPQELKTTVEKAAHHLIIRRHAAQLEKERRQVRFQFISVVAHELKSPLSAVESYLQLLLDSKQTFTPEKTRHMIDRCAIRLEGMRKLVMDLLDLTRLESGQKKRDVQATDLMQALDRAVESARLSGQPRGITVEVHGPETLILPADTTELDIVFNNLLSNAVKYNRDNGRVDITVSDTPDDITIRVQDTGIGMSRVELDRLFGEFVRIKNAKTRGILGSGLGLSILKKIAELYDGTVQVESEPDVGSAFTVTLKKATLESAEPDQASPE